MLKHDVCQVAALFAALGLTFGVARADVFSIDVSSPSTFLSPVGQLALGPVFPPDAILGSGPHVHVPSPFGWGNDVDALSSGHDSVDGTDVIYFSVDRNSSGLASGYVPSGNPIADTMNVNGQAQLYQQAADVYVTVDPLNTYSVPSGYNRLHADDQNFGLLPHNWFFEMNQGDGIQDNLDAYSMEEFDLLGGDGRPDVPVFFSLVADSQALVENNWGPADILVYDPYEDTFDLFLDQSILLGPEAGRNDLDALALNVVTDPYMNILHVEAYFSLAPYSNYLLDHGYSPADIFRFVGQVENNELVNAATMLWYSHDQLGLAFEDNVDALETNAAVPEPATLMLLVAGAAGLGRRRR